MHYVIVKEEVMKQAIFCVLAFLVIADSVYASDWQREIADLKEEVQILRRRIKSKFESGVSAETNDLQVQSGKRGESIRELNIRIDDLEHQLAENYADFERINRDIEIRIKMIEGKEVPATLSAPAPAIPTTFEAPVANEAARSVVGDEIKSGDLAPIEDYSDMQYEY